MDFAALFRLRPGSGPARTLRLAPRRIVRLHPAPGSVVSVAAGRVWLTQPGDCADHFVSAGERLRLSGRGPVLVESDGAGGAVLRLHGGTRLGAGEGAASESEQGTGRGGVTAGRGDASPGPATCGAGAA
jgi:hypothetical protein